MKAISKQNSSDRYLRLRGYYKAVCRRLL